MNARDSALAVLLCTLSCATAWAEEGLPQRKAGLWESTMQLAGGPAGPAMNSRQCVDAKTDAEMQRKGMAGGPGNECRQTSVKRSAGKVEIEAECSSAEGKSHLVASLSGDFKSSYTMDNRISFDPPRHGVSQAHVTLQARYIGACPADMKPGDIRMANGMTLNPSQGRGAGTPGMPAGVDLDAIKNMSPEERKAMIEQMKKMMPPKSP